MGLLEIHGTLDVNQFWPDGTSDADTTKLLVKVVPGGFRFKGKPTNAFRDAFMGGKPVISRQGFVTIRLQGIDAPELHFRPTFRDSPAHEYTPDERLAVKKVNAEFRQKLGETGAKALGDFLKASHSAPTVNCVVRSRVKKPNDVFDMFGRMIGDVCVRIGGTEVNVNHWLLERGWALPALYNSMDDDEIGTVLRLAAAAKHARRGVWRHPAKDVRRFDFKLVYRPMAKPNGATDVGPIAFPKIFRRVAAWRVLQKARLTSQSFPEYLRARQDGCYRTADFEKHRRGWKADTKYLHQLCEFVALGGRFTAEPEGLVFVESGSTLRTAQGRRITSW